MPFRRRVTPKYWSRPMPNGGPACLGHMRGMFAFALWDRQEKSLFIARDRLGVKPLYYYHDEEKILFASEIRAILATGEIKREINEEALIDLFSYQSVGGTNSIIKGIRQLEAGCWMKITGKKDGLRTILGRHPSPRRLRFQRHRRGPVPDQGPDAAIRKAPLVSDVPVGAFLSGASTRARSLA